MIIWLNLPQVESFFPEPGGRDIPANSAIRITFTRLMQADTVTSRLLIEPARSGKFTWQEQTLIFLPDRPWPGQTTVTVTLQPGARTTGFLRLPMLAGETWSFTSRGARLLYLWPAGAPADLYSLDPVAGDIQRLTESANLQDYCVDPTGQAIYITVMREAGSAILRVAQQAGDYSSVSSAEPEQVLDCPREVCRSLACSPDGHYLAFEKVTDPALGAGEEIVIWLYDIAAARSLALSEPNQISLLPDWSSTGVLAYFNRSRQVYVFVDPNTQTRREAANQTSAAGDWLPASDRFIAPEIFYLSSGDEPALASSHLMEYPADGSQPVDRSVQLGDPLVEDQSPAYSSDGAWLAFGRKYIDAERWSPGRQLWLMRTDGSQARQLTQASLYQHYAFAWSPDNLQIAYVRFTPLSLNEPPELWLIDILDGRTIQLVIGGYAPQWSP